MKRKTLKYILPISLLLFSFSLAYGQQKEGKENRAVVAGEESLFTLKGVSVSADLFGYINRLFGNSISSEVAVEFNLRNQFFPIIEAGYGSYDETNENNLIHYQSAAPYFRVGLNYNFMYKKGKTPSPSFGYVGFRYGFSTFNYDVDAPNLIDPVWGGEVPFQYNDVNGNYHWFELCGGIKAKIWKNLYMGWCIRYKARINVKNSPHSNSWYIPGFGESRHTTFGGTYSIIYNIPFKKK